MIQRNSSSNAFTLVELSIVVVLIGLLAAVAVTGKSIIDVSKMNKVIKQVNEYKTAINLFQSKHSALPGDFSDATSFWGGTTTNGNGDGVIGGIASATADAEFTRSWQHLSLSKFISGSYSGTFSGPAVTVGFFGGAGFSPVSGKDAPVGAYDGSIYILLNPDFGGLYHIPYDIKNNTTIWFLSATGGILTTDNAFSIDSKVDDGVANKGNVLGFGTDNNCTGVALNTAGGADYLTNSSNSPVCILSFTIE